MINRTFTRKEFIQTFLFLKYYFRKLNIVSINGKKKFE